MLSRQSLRCDLVVLTIANGHFAQKPVPALWTKLSTAVSSVQMCAYDMEILVHLYMVPS